MVYSKSDVLFVGDSHIELCNWSNVLNNPNVKNLGIHGNVLEGVINQVNNFPLTLRPKEINIMVGINDLRRHKTVAKLILDYDSLINKLVDKYPSVKLNIYSILPISNHLEIFDKKIILSNIQLQKLALKYSCYYIDLYPLFVHKEKYDLKKEYTYDGLHLNGSGYLVWGNIINNN
jgi:lysophospholipase L1-like esterase